MFPHCFSKPCLLSELTVTKEILEAAALLHPTPCQAACDHVVGSNAAGAWRTIALHPMWSGHSMQHSLG